MGSKMKVDGKVFVVTGAGSGVGRQLTLELTQRGAQVAAVDVREEPLLETKALAGLHVKIFVADVTDERAVQELPAKVVDHFGKVDGLINNAGIIQKFVSISELNMDDARHVMAVNFTGPLLMIKSFLPHLVKRPQGHIVNVSSMGAYAPVPGQSIYGASKAAIAQLTDGLRSELLDTPVDVTLVFPGAMNTNIAANSGIEMSMERSVARKIKTLEPAKAARLMVDAIESGKDRIFVGQDAKMMNVLSRLGPKLAAALIYRQMKNLLS